VSTIEVASPASVDYLETLWCERTDNEFPRAKFAAYGQTQVSALIERVLSRPALQTISEAVLDEINELGREVGKSFAPRDRAQAARILQQLRKDVRIRRYNDAKAEADKELDELLTPAF
jgi:hypothetical protein